MALIMTIIALTLGAIGTAGTLALAKRLRRMRQDIANLQRLQRVGARNHNFEMLQARMDMELRGYERRLDTLSKRIDQLECDHPISCRKIDTPLEPFVMDSYKETCSRCGRVVARYGTKAEAKERLRELEILKARETLRRHGEHEDAPAQKEGNPTEEDARDVAECIAEALEKIDKLISEDIAGVVGREIEKIKGNLIINRETDEC